MKPNKNNFHLIINNKLNFNDEIYYFYHLMNKLFFQYLLF
jgi:hypothetical protein